jgi:hypothetical protein
MLQKNRALWAWLRVKPNQSRDLQTNPCEFEVVSKEVESMWWWLSLFELKWWRPSGRCFGCKPTQKCAMLEAASQSKQYQGGCEHAERIFFILFEKVTVDYVEKIINNYSQVWELSRTEKFLTFFFIIQWQERQTFVNSLNEKVEELQKFNVWYSGKE